jgi:MoxR-vWA-beta-propeller ternary system domain bpX2
VGTWVCSLARSRGDRLARLVEFADIEIAELGDLLWVRGLRGDEAVAPIVELLPAARFFELVETDRLRPIGRLVPTARLPAATTFLPLRRWLELRVPPVALPGETNDAVELRLVPGKAKGGGEELLLTPIETFRAFLSDAPSHRLRPLRFAVNGTGEALVRGRPLPSIPGARYLSRGGVAVPAGWMWTPAVGLSVVRSWLGLAPSTLAIWRVDGTVGEVAESLFAPATRRARHAL